MARLCCKEEERDWAGSCWEHPAVGSTIRKDVCANEGENTYRKCMSTLFEIRWTRGNWNTLGNPGSMVTIKLTLTLVQVPSFCRTL